MARSFQELPDWSFDADEVSPGVYRAFGRDRAGRRAVGLHPGNSDTTRGSYWEVLYRDPNGRLWN